jgi:RecA-family ATPase
MVYGLIDLRSCERKSQMNERVNPERSSGPSALASYQRDPGEPDYAHIRPRSFADWSEGEPPDRDWLVDGLIPMGTVTFISGDGGLGKSLLGQQLVMAAALGANWCGRPVKTVPSVAMFCEDKIDEIRRRAIKIASALNVARDDPRFSSAQFICRVGENNMMMYSTWRGEHHAGYRLTELYQELRAFARRRQARLVLIDSLHDVFVGNESFRPEARAFVQAMANIANAINGAVVVLAHPSLNGLDNGSGTSGSTAWNNAVRSRLYLTVPETAGRGSEVRLLTTVKSNYGRTGEKIYLKRRGGTFVPIGSDELPRAATRVKRIRRA